MFWKEQDPEILREVTSVGKYYGDKIEYYAKRKERIKRALRYLNNRLCRYTCPLLTIKLILKLKKELSITQKELDKYLYYMIVYREAIGLTYHETLYKVYNLSND